jgi:hypothetical protein
MKSAANAGLLCIKLSLPHAAAEPDLAGQVVPPVSEEEAVASSRTSESCSVLFVVSAWRSQDPAPLPSAAAPVKGRKVSQRSFASRIAFMA